LVTKAAQNEANQRKGQPKVLLIDLGAQFGGVENYLVSLAGLLQGEVELHALCVLPELAKRLEAVGAKTTLLPAMGGALKPLRFLLTALILPVLLLRDRIDIIQVNGFLEATLMLEARLLGRRAVYTRHGPFEMDLFPWYRAPLKFLPRALARISVHLATQVVCVSETVGIGVRKIRPAVPTVVIPNWLAGQGAPQALRNDPARPVAIVCASRLERYKGTYLAIAAIREVPGARLVVVGDGPYRASLEELATDLIASGKVEFAGFQKDMQPYYELADIFCMPSLGPEGLPMSSLEAMGRGLPCILSDLPVHREITDNGAGAMLFATGDEASLQQAMTSLAADVAVRAKFASEGYRIIGERYTAERVRVKYLKVFAGNL
jgi:glycosyltransferase involved in cell wall biosynthesis